MLVTCSRSCCEAAVILPIWKWQGDRRGCNIYCRIILFIITIKVLTHLLLMTCDHLKSHRLSIADSHTINQHITVSFHFVTLWNSALSSARNACRLYRFQCIYMPTCILEYKTLWVSCNSCSSNDYVCVFFPLTQE